MKTKREKVQDWMMVGGILGWTAGGVGWIAASMLWPAAVPVLFLTMLVGCVVMIGAMAWLMVLD